MVFGILGGVGIFLLGMILLTDGLKAAAGDALRSVLARATGSPLSGVASGAGVAALVQSSSATTLATIGFVSAGLLTFPQAVGVIFGSNLGTTSTGWIVSLLGLKLRVGELALPLIGLGALLRLLSRGRRAQLGLALAGFGLIFVGIDTLQVGMASLAERIDPASFPDPTFVGAFLLVLMGGVMTVVMQSSSAAVATTLTALHAGTLNLEQAALLVIGQNLGTTVKAALAAVGASVPAKRTALAHILFNVATGVMALLLLPFLLPVLAGWVGGDDPAVTVAAFHTVFNLLGVIVLFPLLGPFCTWIEGWIPEPGRPLTRHLDRSVAEVPAVAVEAARRAVSEIAELVFRTTEAVVQGKGQTLSGGADPAQNARAAIGEVRDFLSFVHTPPEMEDEYARHVAVLHASDHLERLLDALEGVKGPPGSGIPGGSGEGRRVTEAGGGVLEILELAQGALAREPEVDGTAPVSTRIEAGSRALAELRRTMRARSLEEIAAGRRSPDEAFQDVERVRFLDRIGYHCWRASHHLVAAAGEGLDPEVEEGRGNGTYLGASTSDSAGSPSPAAGEEKPRV